MTHFVSLAKDLARLDDIPETAQHMRIAECWLPGEVWEAATAFDTPKEENE
jgi:hypothetical protein